MNRPSRSFAALLLASTPALAQNVDFAVNQSICATPQLTTGTATQAAPNADVVFQTDTVLACGTGVAGLAAYSFGSAACPGVPMNLIVQPAIGTFYGGATPWFSEFSNPLGCSGPNETWRHTLTLPTGLIPRTPGLAFNVQHIVLIQSDAGQLTYGIDNAVEFRATAQSPALAAWGVPPAHVYENDGRSAGSSIRIPLLAFRHEADGGVGGIRFTRTAPNGTSTTQTVTTRTIDTPTASTSGSPFVIRASGPPDQQSQLEAFFYADNAATLADGLHRLRADVLDASGTVVIATVEDMSFWNNWNGSAITYHDRFVDSSTGSDSNSGTQASPVQTIQGALVSFQPGGGFAATRNGTSTAQFLRLHLVGSAEQVWGGANAWQPGYQTDPETWIEVIGESATPTGNVLRQDNSAFGVTLTGEVWIHFRNVVIDDDWGLDYANQNFTDSRGWYDGVTMEPGAYANTPHVATILVRQGLDGFHENYGTNILYRNVLDVGTFQVGSDILLEGALLQSAGRFAAADKRFVHWAVEVPEQDSRRGEVAGTFVPFNSPDWPWSQNPTLTGIPVTATPMGSLLRIEIPTSAAPAAGFLSAAQALSGLSDVGFKLRHSGGTSTLNEGDWEVVGAGTTATTTYADLDLGGQTPIFESSVFIALKASYRQINGNWDPNGFDPHPDILELQVPAGRDSTSPPLIVQGFRAFAVNNAQLVFTHGGDLINTAFVNCAIGTPNNAPGVINTGAAGVFRMQNFVCRNCYIPGNWNLQTAAGSTAYRDVEVSGCIFNRIDGQPLPAFTGHWLFGDNRFETPTSPHTGDYGELDPNGYTFGWANANRGTSGDFTFTTSVNGLGPRGFAVDGSNSGS